MEKVLTLEKVNDFKYIIPRTEDMRVPGILYISEKLLDKVISDNAPLQVVNIAKLRGITRYSLAMPDVHWGYGAPIGGVGAFDAESGVIVPGFVGFDINCGVRLIRSNITLQDIKNKLEHITNLLFTNIPSGVGSTGKLKLKIKDLERVTEQGAVWAVKNSFGTEEDIENIEEHGQMKDADPDAVSNRAFERGQEQLGTLGSGNHFLEIQQVVNIYDEKTAEVFGLFPGQITIMIHTGSRGLGYQVCDDYQDRFGRVVSEYGLKIPDKQLACAPISSKEGKRYFRAMNAAANYAFANRQIITHWVREVFSIVFETSWEKLQLSLLYDVTHNICKVEKHMVEGREKLLYIHRKGATRAFPKGHPELPSIYKQTGHPVIIPGTMGTSSYVLVGTEKSLEETWGSTSHGAGRIMSRAQAIKENKNRSIDSELAVQGILVKGVSRKGLVEEMPEAYKDIDEVIRVVEGAGLCRKIARMVPLAVIKG